MPPGLAFPDAASWRRTPLPRAGFFTRPFAVEEGPFAGRLEKRLNNRLDGRTAREHLAAIEAYAADLKALGVPLPETAVLAWPDGRRWRLSLFQERFRPEEMVAALVSSRPAAECLALLERLLSQTAPVLRRIAAERGAGAEERLGFHSSLRNWARRGDALFFLDLTPPLRRRGGRLAPPTFLKHIPLRFLPFRLPLVRDFFTRLATRDSFLPEVLVAGVVTSAIRRRPELEEGILSLGRRFVEREVPEGQRAPFLARLGPRRLKRHRLLNRVYRRLFPA